MEELSIKKYNNYIKISIGSLIAGFFIFGIIFAAIADILSFKAYKVSSEDNKRRKTAILIHSISIGYSVLLSTWIGNNKYESTFEMFLSAILVGIIYYLIFIFIDSKKHNDNSTTNDYKYYCPKCNFSIDYGDRFCKNCSSKIDWDEENDDDFFKDEIVFSNDNLKEVLKKLNYKSYISFKNSVYENKNIKKKTFDNKEEECDYLVRALGYDDFTDFYKSNMQNK